MSRSLARQRSDRHKNLVGFEVADVRYAAEILRVREIINPLPLVLLPGAPPSIVGVADHRGLVVPVLDLRLRFGLARTVASGRTKWVVISRGANAREGGRPVALIVDAVTEVFAAGAGDQREVPHLAGDERAKGISAVYATTEGLVFVLDVDTVTEPSASIDVSHLGRDMELPTGVMGSLKSRTSDRPVPGRDES